MTSVSVILPTYNEASNVGWVVGSLRDELEHRDHEVLVIDDNSPDGTPEVVRERFGDDDRVQLVVRRQESGLASAVVRGFREAAGDVYVVMDADGQHPITAPNKLLLGIEHAADLVVGSRHADAGRVEADWPLHRRVVSRGAQALAWVAVPRARALTDPLSGLFAVRSECVDPVLDRLRPHGYKVLLEVLARCPVETVGEAGYSFKTRDGGESNLGPREYVAYLHHLAALSIPARRGPTPPAVDGAEVEG